MEDEEAIRRRVRIERHENYQVDKRVYWYGVRKRWKGRLIMVVAAIVALVVLSKVLFH